MCMHVYFEKDFLQDNIDICFAPTETTSFEYN